VQRSFSVTAEVAAAEAEEASVRLFEAGAAGVEERDGSIAPMPGARRPGPGRALLVAWFDDVEAARVAAAGLPGAVIGEVEGQDWGEAWKAGLSAFGVGRVFLRPSWIRADVPPGSVEVVLDPGMAFGTGTHPTTALCLSALDAFLAGRSGATVLDVGTGSGLLAIAARKLGAGRVVASDNDPVALEVASENAARNGVEIEIVPAEATEVRGPFDLVVANILANTLVELAPGLAAQVAAGGALLLSGILLHQEEEVRAAYVARGLVPAEGRRDGEWSLLAFRREP
jgi:ribosomal protein L11 methyltransferase